MTPALGKPVIVEAKPGAAGAIAVNDLVSSPHDGHTLLLIQGGIVTETPQAYKVSFDPFKDLKPLAQVSRQGLILVGNKDLPANWKQKVMHATVEADGAQIMGSDMPPGMGSGGYNGITVSVYIKQDTERARKVFEALAQGGQVMMPFAPPFWGGQFGMLKDRYGVPWMVSTE